MTTRSETLVSRLRRLPTVKNGDKIGLRACESIKIEQVDEAQNELIVIATTDDVDLEQEVVLPSGAAPDSYFFRNRKMFVDHEPDVEKCVGSMRSARPYPSAADHRQWRVRCHIYRNQGNELADYIWKMAVTDGIGVSIGFRALDAGPMTPAESRQYPGADSIVRAWEWLELSFTAFPCNVSCQSLSVIESQTRAAQLTEMACKGAMSAKVAKALGVKVPVKPTTIIVA